VKKESANEYNGGYKLKIKTNFTSEKKKITSSKYISEFKHKTKLDLYGVF